MLSLNQAKHLGFLGTVALMLSATPYIGHILTLIGSISVLISSIN